MAGVDWIVSLMHTRLKHTSLTDTFSHIAADRETVGNGRAVHSFARTVFKVRVKVDAFVSPFSTARSVDGTVGVSNHTDVWFWQDSHGMKVSRTVQLVNVGPGEHLLLAAEEVSLAVSTAAACAALIARPVLASA